ncbi:hypothetical protein Bbelb_093610 [Branchiostoma belcheri]|nr:hypothetical protein Bbelb_093610 [Branchiostoma belcheri]
MAAASLPLEEFDEKFLTCAVCQEIYTDPRVLPCLHTFCAKCLEKWRQGKSQFTCPTCREQVRLRGTDVRGLPPYFFMNSLLDFRALHNSEGAHTKCEMCKSDNKVEGRCADCSFLLCKNCITAHSHTPVLKDHYIITMDDLKNPSVKPKYARAPYCPRHTDQRMTFYCKPCAKLICRDCTITEHRPGHGSNHDPQEVSEVAQKYKAELQKLLEKTKDTNDALKKTKETVGYELTSITTNCQTVTKEIKKHFADMRAKLDEEEKKAKEKLDKMEKDQKEPLVKEEKELEKNIKSTEEGLQFSTEILSRGNDVEILTLRQQLQDRLNALSSTQIEHEALKNKISFKSDALYTDLVHCYLFLSEETLFITEAPVESLPTIVIFRPQKDVAWKTNPQVTVTSPGGQCVKLDTSKASGGAFKAVWRPQTSGKHVVGATGGGRSDVTGRESLCSPLTVDVGNNDPVLRFGKKGSQHGQFDSPIDLAVRVQTDGTIMVKCGNEVKKFTPSGELLHKFSLCEHCTKPYALAVQRNGRVLVADDGKHSIFLFEADGTLVKQVGGQGKGYGQFNDTGLVCVDNQGNTIVSDVINNHVQVFDNNLNFRHKFGQQGKEPQDMFRPIGVSADSRGNIVLANLGGTTDGIGHSRKLQVFRPDGTWVSTISSDGDKLNRPHGVAVTEDGHVFVADTQDHCIRKYRYILPEHPGTKTPLAFCRLFIYVGDLSAPGYSRSYLAGAVSESVTAKTSAGGDVEPVGSTFSPWRLGRQNTAQGLCTQARYFLFLQSKMGPSFRKKANENWQLSHQMRDSAVRIDRSRTVTVTPSSPGTLCDPRPPAVQRRIGWVRRQGVSPRPPEAASRQLRASVPGALVGSGAEKLAFGFQLSRRDGCGRGTGTAGRGDTTAPLGMPNAVLKGPWTSSADLSTELHSLNTFPPPTESRGVLIPPLPLGNLRPSSLPRQFPISAV